MHNIGFWNNSNFFRRNQAKIAENSYLFYVQLRIKNLPWRRGVVVSANRTEGRRFESHRDVRFFGLHCNVVPCNLIRIVVVCIWVKWMYVKKWKNMSHTVYACICSVTSVNWRHCKFFCSSSNCESRLGNSAACHSWAGWPDEFVKKSPKMLPKTHAFGEIGTYLTLRQSVFGYLSNFHIITQNKQPPHRRKIAQSGRPAH
jgi:hypothetical protein